MRNADDVPAEAPIAPALKRMGLTALTAYVLAAIFGALGFTAPRLMGYTGLDALSMTVIIVPSALLLSAVAAGFVGLKLGMKIWFAFLMVGLAMLCLSLVWIPGFWWLFGLTPLIAAATTAGLPRRIVWGVWGGVAVFVALLVMNYALLQG